jgi:hypothetical protein
MFVEATNKENMLLKLGKKKLSYNTMEFVMSDDNNIRNKLAKKRGRFVYSSM